MIDNFTVQHKEGDSKGKFFIANEEGQEIALSTYSKAGAERIIIDHTEVDDSLRGKGAGLALVIEAVQYARDKSIKILPLCPFAKSVFNKHPEFRDVL
ncbi:MAG TPA: GNAT family N-acetyltransferase [Cytophagales bacterium]|nr:GNAT family N-acetyltransferase [Cytophagales bacterium]HAA20252.1 GNAT family N-acetyltransferase [Cytophagales bacterium]HAP61786.1 GNAT family N-acetyltransferase [Cytophagales bacterium]